MEDRRDSRPRPVLHSSAELDESRTPTLWVVLSDDSRTVGDAIERKEERPLLVATHRTELRDRHEDPDTGVRFFLTGHDVGSGFNGLLNVRDILLSAYFDGAIASDDRILVQIQPSAAWDGWLWYDLSRDQSIARLRRELEYRADINVIEAVLHVAAEIAREGRERGHVGAIFIVGDADRVMANSRSLVLNPFEGHPPEVRQMSDPRNWETAKEFAQIDGAFVVDTDGLIVAAGRYIDVHSTVDLPSGLGGRHLASAAITKETKAIAITVSETGVIRIFKDGEILMRIGTT